MRRAIRISRQLGLLGFVASGAILVSMAVTLRLSYQDTTFAAHRTAENVLKFVVLEVADSVGTVRGMLEDLRFASKSPAIAALPDDEVERVLIGRTERTRQLSALAIIDAEGKVTVSSTPLLPAGFDASDFESFKAQRDDPAQGLYISRPFEAPFGEPSVAITLRRTDAHGRFEGVALGVLRLAAVSDVMDTAQLGSDGKISLMTAGGTLLARTRMFGKPVDVTQENEKIDPLRALLKGPTGSFITHSPVDGLERHYVYAALPDLPLVVWVSMSDRQIYGEWYRRAAGMAGVTGLSALGIVTLTLLFRRELLRRAQIEAQLAALATVDSLTGIANRRRFDERLAQEWRRSYRAMLPLGLIMIDVDNFKAFNDHYGHWLGDDLLIHIADAVSRALRRPGDLAARYGGEEFAVILPETNTEGAMRIAEQIRAAIAATGIEDPTGRVVGATASLGVAVMVPRLGTDAGTLVQRADAALYTAKDSGRNRVMVAPDEPAVLPTVAEAS